MPRPIFNTNDVIRTAQERIVNAPVDWGTREPDFDLPPVEPEAPIKKKLSRRAKGRKKFALPKSAIPALEQLQGGSSLGGEMPRPVDELDSVTSGRSPVGASASTSAGSEDDYTSSFLQSLGDGRSPGMYIPPGYEPSENDINALNTANLGTLVGAGPGLGAAVLGGSLGGLGASMQQEANPLVGLGAGAALGGLGHAVAGPVSRLAGRLGQKISQKISPNLDEALQGLNLGDPASAIEDTRILAPRPVPNVQRFNPADLGAQDFPALPQQEVSALRPGVERIRNADVSTYKRPSLDTEPVSFTPEPRGYTGAKPADYTTYQNPSESFRQPFSYDPNNTVFPSQNFSAPPEFRPPTPPSEMRAALDLTQADSPNALLGGPRPAPVEWQSGQQIGADALANYDDMFPPGEYARRNAGYVEPFQPEPIGPPPAAPAETFWDLISGFNQRGDKDNKTKLLKALAIAAGFDQALPNLNQ
jgi:hypothetical protein